ncbi:hypothetical protein B0A48_10814 [Cryoendolithus antarcticus]|uniref:Uncharacterized protein n=1 Tax=Cryoendolithus antarcticus TaxID=1507870 RepID=A0A1V8SYP8_9PEZI|nr:hypothetical protein B0A48_10814 [Cryoendolithus antarcticus]
MGSRIDLRVHAGASTTRKDDNRYKAQAAAYADFQSTGRIALLEIQSHQSGSEDALNVGPHGAVASPVLNNLNSLANRAEDAYQGVVMDNTTIFLDDTQLGYSVLESQLHSSRHYLPTAKPVSPGPAFTQRKRPAESAYEATLPPCKKAKVSPVTVHVDDVISPATSPSQSSYLKTPVLDRTRQQDPPSSPVSSPVDQLQSLSLPAVPNAELREGAGSSHEPPELASSQVESLRDVQAHRSQSVSHELSSQLPTTYSLSDITSDRTSKQQSGQRSVSDPGPVLQSSLVISRPTPDGPHTQHASTRIAGQQTLPSPVHVPASANLSAQGYQNLRQKAPEASSPQTTSLSAQPTLPITIQPPPPETSLGPLESHITPTLAFLASQPSLTSSYKPVLLARELRPTERGCWTFSTDSWHAGDQTAFFDFLQKMISEGRVGWGVHCIREIGESGQGMVKVFCWGEVVMHVYLLLYAASKSKVSKMGLQWVDAEGKIVVQMRGRGDAAVEGNKV